jgi:hypothetical protein
MPQHTQTNRKGKIHTIITIDAEKALDKMQCPYMIKAKHLNKLDMEIHLNTKNCYTATVILKAENM